MYLPFFSPRRASEADATSELTVRPNKFISIPLEPLWLLEICTAALLAEPLEWANRDIVFPDWDEWERLKPLARVPREPTVAPLSTRPTRVLVPKTEEEMKMHLREMRLMNQTIVEKEPRKVWAGMMTTVPKRQLH